MPLDSSNFARDLRSIPLKSDFASKKGATSRLELELHNPFQKELCAFLHRNSPFREDRPLLSCC